MFTIELWMGTHGQIITLRLVIVNYKVNLCVATHLSEKVSENAGCGVHGGRNGTTTFYKKTKECICSIGRSYFRYCNELRRGIAGRIVRGELTHPY